MPPRAAAAALGSSATTTVASAQPLAPLWGLDPLFHVRVKLLARSLAAATGPPPGGPYAAHPAAPRFIAFAPGQPPRPVRLVAVAGVVVALARFQKLTRFTLDDGSALAHCVVWAADRNPRSRSHPSSSSRGAPPPPAVPLNFGLGDFVRVSGRLDVRPPRAVEVVVDTAAREADPHAELLWWREVADLHRRVYAKPFVPTVAHSPDSASSSANGMSAARLW